jgi:dTDP-4-amino-4,6-dideoxygalactose transaminase
MLSSLPPFAGEGQDGGKLNAFSDHFSKCRGTHMKVPFLDLKAQYNTIKTEIQSALDAVMESAAFAGGPFVEKFESEFAEYNHCRQVVGCGSGTDALRIALFALGVGKGHEVITVPNTFIATAEAITWSGAEPVFVDVDEKTCTMNPALLEKAVTSKTRAVIPVHLFGQPADMDPIMAAAKKHGLFVIEDACQAHGAEYKGRIAGTIGDAGCFSFYPGKNLGAYGEGGAVATNNDSAAETMRIFRDHGQPRKYYHDLIGWNARMDGIQGAVLSVKLRYLNQWNDARRRCARRYNDLLAGIKDLTLPVEADYARHVYHIYAIRLQHRDALMNALMEKEIGCGIHYPVPIHLQAAYRHMNLAAGTFPVAEKTAAELVSLPMFPELMNDQIEFTAETIRKHAKNF